MEHASFQVVVSDYTCSVDEWRRAQKAAKSELPELNEAQREVARKFGIGEEEYARSVLAGHYGMRRMAARARKLGEEVEGILRDLSPTYRVVMVVAEMFRGRWIVRLKSPDKEAGVAVPRELGDDLLDSRLREAAEQLRARVLHGLGLGDRGVQAR
jgi:predicted component of type VI protein secretion system